MDITKSLLSKRFQADGKPISSLERRMGPSAKKALLDFHQALINGELNRLWVEKCPLCSATQGMLIAEKDRLGVPCRTVICKTCGLVFNQDPLEPSALNAFYEKYWAAIQWGPDPEENFSKRIRPGAYSWKRFAYLGLSLRENMHTVKNVLEIGCGDGCNLVPFYLAGKSVFGVDLDEDVLKVGRDFGLRLEKGSMETILEQAPFQADCIILSHVFEHFLDPWNSLDTIKKLLKPGGYVYVEVPGLLNQVRSPSQALIEDGYRSTSDLLEYLQFQHTFHFTLEHVASLWAHKGFKLLQGDQWVRAVFQPADGNRSKNVQHDLFDSIYKHLKASEEKHLNPMRKFHAILRTLRNPH